MFPESEIGKASNETPRVIRCQLPGADAGGKRRHGMGRKGGGHDQWRIIGQQEWKNQADLADALVQFLLEKRRGTRRASGPAPGLARRFQCPRSSGVRRTRRSRMSCTPCADGDVMIAGSRAGRISSFGLLAKYGGSREAPLRQTRIPARQR